MLEFVGRAMTLTLSHVNIMGVISLRTWSTLKTAVLFLAIFLIFASVHYPETLSSHTIVLDKIQQ